MELSERMRKSRRDSELEGESMGEGGVPISVKVTTGSPFTGMDNAGGRMRFGTRDDAHLFCSAHLIIALVLLLPSAGRHPLISFGVTKVCKPLCWALTQAANYIS